MIKKCTCKNEYQDKKHGKNNRVFNATGKKNKQAKTAYRCTVCGSEK